MKMQMKQQSPQSPSSPPASHRHHHHLSLQRTPDKPFSKTSKFSIESLVSKEDDNNSRNQTQDLYPLADSPSSVNSSPIPSKSSSPEITHKHGSDLSPGSRSPFLSSWHGQSILATSKLSSPSSEPIISVGSGAFHSLKRQRVERLTSSTVTVPPTAHTLSSTRLPGLPTAHSGVGLSPHAINSHTTQTLLSGFHQLQSTAHGNPFLAMQSPGIHSSAAAGMLGSMGPPGSGQLITREPFGSLYPWLLARNRMLAAGHRFPGE